MVFGILKDIKEGENRVICTPVEVASIVAAGHTVLAQRDCGVGSGFSNEKYEAAGAEIVDTMEEMYARCDFLAKVKELFPCEYDLLRENQLVYCTGYECSYSWRRCCWSGRFISSLRFGRKGYRYGY